MDSPYGKKSKVIQLIQTFSKIVHTMFGRSIKALKIDNDKELALYVFMQSTNTIHQLSYPSNSHHKYVVERYYQHLLKYGLLVASIQISPSI